MPCKTTAWQQILDSSNNVANVVSQLFLRTRSKKNCEFAFSQDIPPKFYRVRINLTPFHIFVCINVRLTKLATYFHQKRCQTTSTTSIVAL